MLVDVTPAFIQSAAISLGELSMIVPNALIAIHDAAKDAATTNIALEGQSKLLSCQSSALKVQDRRSIFLTEQTILQSC